MLGVTRSAGSPALGVLWGKSNAGGTVNLLLQHLLDAAAVAELIWDSYLSPAVRKRVDECCGGRGRSFFALLCALHDVGKASPAFQAKVPELAARVRESGLTWRDVGSDFRNWHHTLAGAVLVRRVLNASGWSRSAVNWVWPLVAGHHGVVPGLHKLADPPGRGNAQGTGRWETVQDELVHRVAAELGVDLVVAAPSRAPRRGVQLAVLGGIIMADWIASNDSFPGVDAIERVSMSGARERARLAWDRLSLLGGWTPARLPVLPDPVAVRFGKPSRPVQVASVALAKQLPAPGLLIIEAPMGEGKTEAALTAVEVLARRFGADGLFVGMPTQATSDPMFSRVRRWASSVEPGLPVGLLHGKARFSREWHELLTRREIQFSGIDQFGCDDPYGAGPAAVVARSHGDPETVAPAEWLLGRNRGLLIPLTVGTIDQLLHAATRTRHVMLRHAGLAGRVVVLDEVHAYDVYMAQFLFEALRWLGDTGVPVILLSATLPPAMRTELVRAYLQGALACRDVDLTGVPAVHGYPSVLSACVVGGEPRFQVTSSQPWRESMPVTVDVLDEPGDGDPEPVVRALREALADGGCALVVRNTVARAQRTYLAAREAFGDDAVLLHARLAIGERADRVEKVLGLLGSSDRDNPPPRPTRLVVVATQVAEQSFDVDVDVLVTDLAPIDLLLQRVGRLHRHARPDARPTPVRTPRVVVTGLTRRPGRPPAFPPGSSYVYGDHLLLRAAGLVLRAATEDGWSVPGQVPDLVARGYGDASVMPAEWSAAAEEAANQHARELGRRTAEGFLLAGPDALGTVTLAGLHDLSTANLHDEDAVAKVVRDGEPSVEVVLVRRGERGYLTLDGRSLGVTGETVSDAEIAGQVIRSAVRLPARPELTRAAEQELRPLPGWGTDPWLSRTRALVLDEAMSARLGGRLLTYDVDLGLVDQRIP